jgi:hypothetical protein
MLASTLSTTYPLSLSPSADRVFILNSTLPMETDRKIAAARPGRKSVRIPVGGGVPDV